MPRVSSTADKKKVSKVKPAVQRRALVSSQPIPDVNRDAGTTNKKILWERVSSRLNRIPSAFEHLKDTPLSKFMLNNLDELFEGAAHKLTVKEVFSKEMLYSETEDGREAKQLLEQHGIKFLDYDYRYRMICVFQQQDSEEVLFFCMTVKEYPVQNWCTLDYLDSVSFYEKVGDVLRTQVYEELIYSYFEFARSIGYERAHIFVCALDNDKEYFFHKRKQGMLLPEQPQLMSWYINLLEKGKERITGFFGNERPVGGGRRVRNQLVEDYIKEVSFSEFFRNSIEDFLLKSTSPRNFISEIEKYPGRYGKQLLYVDFKTVEENSNPIQEETIEYEMTKSRNDWLNTLKDKKLSFFTREEAKKSTAAILNMLTPGNH